MNNLREISDYIREAKPKDMYVAPIGFHKTSSPLYSHILVTQFMDYLVIKYLLSTHSMASVTLKVGARGSLRQGSNGDIKILIQKTASL